MALINPHVNFNGNAEEAFNFYRSVFGGEFTKIIRFKDLASSGFPIAKKEENKRETKKLIKKKCTSKKKQNNIKVERLISKYGAHQKSKLFQIAIL